MTSTLPTTPERIPALLDRDWRLLVGGRLVPAASGRTYTDDSPVTGAAVAHVPDAGPDDVDTAADAAADAAAGWRQTAPLERAAIVRQMARVLADHAEELAFLDTVDAGNPIAEMRRDVDAAASQMDLMAGLAIQLRGDTIPATAEHLHYTVREPFGVAARIIPFNHPVMFAAAKIAAPLIAGNAVLLKPAETAPLSALRLGELFAGLLPPGVLSVLVGDGHEVPRAIVRHPAVRRIGFIGSEPSGRSVQRDAAETGVKHVTLELGGKNALVACADADPEQVARSAVTGMNFTWAGQSCGSTSRLLVHASIAEEVVSRIVDRVTALRISSPLDSDCEMGTMASRAQFDKALRYLDIARQEGARVRTGGGRPDVPGLEGGLFVAPTVLDQVRPDMRIANEEVFGPVLSVLTWEDEDEAVQVANRVAYGLTASIWTSDLRRAHRLARSLAAGYIWINGSARHFPGVPFGGVKSSGIGREESLEELLSYTELKSVNVLLD